MIERAREVGNENVLAVIGSFHLLQHSDHAIQKIIAQFKQLGIRTVGPTHCTGDPQIGQLRNALGAEFLEMGAAPMFRFE
jgi:7,8-dihydropterin-6-yl-methyl-4-(beta-D-ribofuranosyl)aminobenzene 5'-phosphate synthase